MLRSRVSQELRCSSSHSCFEAVGAGSFPHSRPTAPRPAGPSGYLLSAGEAGSLTSHLLLGCRGAGAKKRNREDKGQVSNRPCNSPLVARAAPRLPPLPAWPWTLLFPRHPIAKGLNVAQCELRWPVGCPKPAHGRFQHPGKCSLEALRQHGEDALPRGAELLSRSPPHGKERGSPAGAGCSEHTSPLPSPWWSTQPSPHLPTLRHRWPDHKARSPDPGTPRRSSAALNNLQPRAQLQLQLTSDAISSSLPQR